MFMTYVGSASAVLLALWLVIFVIRRACSNAVVEKALSRPPTSRHPVIFVAAHYISLFYFLIAAFLLASGINAGFYFVSDWRLKDDVISYAALPAAVVLYGFHVWSSVQEILRRSAPG